MPKICQEISEVCFLFILVSILLALVFTFCCSPIGCPRATQVQRERALIEAPLPFSPPSAVRVPIAVRRVGMRERRQVDNYWGIPSNDPSSFRIVSVYANSARALPENGTIYTYPPPLFLGEGHIDSLPLQFPTPPPFRLRVHVSTWRYRARSIAETFQEGAIFRLNRFVWRGPRLEMTANVLLAVAFGSSINFLVDPEDISLDPPPQPAVPPPPPQPAAPYAPLVARRDLNKRSPPVRVDNGPSLCQQYAGQPAEGPEIKGQLEKPPLKLNLDPLPPHHLQLEMV
uniref:Uncharacterized protein n=1 Tax=Globodera rostochiensis TaxID=31243 RepID=A0A914HCI6_GLORO